MLRINKLGALLCLLPSLLFGQSRLSLDAILQKIDSANLMLQLYGLKAESYKHSAEAATGWMAPMVGVGTFMTPYPLQKIMDGRDKGSLMFRAEQEIPNRAKQNARRDFIASQGNIELAARTVTVNDYHAEAKRLYYNWVVAQQRINILQENEKIMETMKKIEALRYPYNQSSLGDIYKIDARIEENRNRISTQEGEIERSRAWLNSLMNQPGEDFDIDALRAPEFKPMIHDTALLSEVRGDVLKIDESIRSMQLNIQSTQQEKKPDFKIQLDHMHAFDPMMPKSFSVMGMISIPIAPWSSKTYKSELKSMQLNVEAMEKERSALLQETRGRLSGLQSEILHTQKRILALESKIIPSLQKSLDVNLLAYQENKLQATVVIDSWEALNMMQLDLLDEKLNLYQMIVEYEKEIYR
ncbi:MAG: TolC family protein [Chitinophagaceae bacterium]|nr:TolC family protein [Chitinophagaceae bacterium]